MKEAKSLCDGRFVASTVSTLCAGVFTPGSARAKTQGRKNRSFGRLMVWCQLHTLYVIRPASHGASMKCRENCLGYSGTGQIGWPRLTPLVLPIVLPVNTDSIDAGMLSAPTAVSI